MMETLLFWEDKVKFFFWEGVTGEQFGYVEKTASFFAATARSASDEAII
jgi:hypothetical protein